MSTLQQLSNTFINRLKQVENHYEADAILSLVYENILGLNKLQCLQNKDLELTAEQESKINNILSRLENSEPIQYILEEAWFYDLRFTVTPSVLIPRQETEELVDWVIKDHKNRNSQLSILDLGTGSGCIPITLKKYLSSAEVYACDISKEALEIATQNSIHNGVDVHFFQANILNHPILPISKFDVIVSNPPYVTKKEMVEINTKVLNHEPHLALFVENNDPLIFYRKIAHLAQSYLSESGSLYLEINQYLGKETMALLTKLNFQAELKQDLNGNNRMIKARLKKKD